MFDNFKRNIAAEKELIARLKEEKDASLLQSCVNQLKILNAAVPELLKTTSPVRSVNQGQIDLVEVFFSRDQGNVLVRNADKNLFNSQNKAFKKKEDKAAEKEDKSLAAVKPSAIRGISNSFFRGPAEKLLPSMSGLTSAIKRANMTVLPATYLAMALFFTFLSVFLGIAIYGVLLFLSLDYWIYFWVIFGVPGLVFAGFYYYPQSEANGVEKAISYELPFATIHMTAIAGSNIEPTKIFQIISNSKEYVNIGREMQKIIVLIRVYGYDLVTSLKDVASRTSNQKLSELLSGLATNISGGGELKTYLEKKSENFLLDYQLERRKYIDLASTFMDIYISILIAAPMVLMLMFIIMNVAGLGFQGISIQVLLMISVLAIIVVNILFIIAINLKQPKV